MTRLHVGDRVMYRWHSLILGRWHTFTEHGVVEIARRTTAVIRVFGYTREVPNDQLTKEKGERR
jgi:hypothetical protein